MGMEIFNFPQNSELWHLARCGIPTASNFQCLMVKTGDKRGRATYLRKLAAERITGKPAASYSNKYMERGHEWESEACDRYSMLKRVDLEVVGFVTNHGAGCSPDRFVIGQSGMVEIKTQEPELLIETILRDEFPTEHKGQTQGGLWICDKDYIDLMIHSQGMPPFIKRAGRDARYIADLTGEVARLNDDVETLVEKIKRYGMAA